MDLLQKSILRAGQAKAYQDSVYQWQLKTTPGTDADAWELCQTLRKTHYRKDSASHNGACGFETVLRLVDESVFKPVGET